MNPKTAIITGATAVAVPGWKALARDEALLSTFDGLARYADF